MMRYPKSVQLAGLWLCLLLLPADSMAAGNSNDLYYSVHIDTAGDINQVNQKINHLDVKEKVVFWEKRDVRGMGTYYKVYLGWFDEFKPARRFMKKLQKAGWEQRMAVHWFKQPPWETQRPAQADAGPARAKSKMPVAAQEPLANRFKDNGNGTVTDKKTGLMWIKNGWRREFFGAVTWQEAMEKCAAFKGGGHTDWRLPTVDEWKSLVDRSISYPALVEPNPFENIISHMPYWSGDEYAYGDKRPAGGAGTLDSYIVRLYSGTFNHQPKTDLAFILPVRTQASK